LSWKGVEGEFNPIPGGHYRVAVTGPEHVAAGSFITIDPYTKVVFSWGWEGEGQPVPPGSSIVEVTFQPDGDETVLTLSHRDLPVEARAPHGEGWDHYLDRLVIRAGGGDPGKDDWIGIQ